MKTNEFVTCPWTASLEALEWHSAIRECLTEGIQHEWKELDLVSIWKQDAKLVEQKQEVRSEFRNFSNVSNDRNDDVSLIVDKQAFLPIRIVPDIILFQSRCVGLLWHFNIPSSTNNLSRYGNFSEINFEIKSETLNSVKG